MTSDGWYKTGDVCTIDEHGIYKIVDRKKELIKVKGVSNTGGLSLLPQSLIPLPPIVPSCTGGTRRHPFGSPQDRRHWYCRRVGGLSRNGASKVRFLLPPSCDSALSPCNSALLQSLYCPGSWHGDPRVRTCQSFFDGGNQLVAKAQSCTLQAIDRWNSIRRGIA